jgi:hypothetical protein
MTHVSRKTGLFIIAAFLLIPLAGCVGAGAALEGMVPVTDAAMQAAVAEQAEAQGSAIRAASDGNGVNAALYSLISALTGVGIVVGASKRRRAKAAAEYEV